MSRRPWMVVMLAVQCLLTLVMFAHPSTAAASEVRLRDRLEVARAPGDGWTWLTLRDTRALRGLPPHWLLHVDQVRFRRVAVITTLADGRSKRTELRADQLAQNFAIGGVLDFPISAPGRDVRELRLGFEDIDDVGLLRKVDALSPHAADRADDGWLLLMGVFAGLLASALVYNLIVFAGQRYPFQRWYLAWVATALLYGLTWTNVFALAFPALAGPAAVRIDSVLVGLMIALGSQFFLGIIEKGRIPRWLRMSMRVVAGGCLIAGVLAANERWLDAHLTDRLLSVMATACVASSLLAVTIAASRGSRVVWSYLIGWSPVIAVFACRMARNFGLLEQSDLIDMATFAALGFESLVFSLLIAGRFMSLRQQRDAAEASARGLEIERETLRRAAQADFLTGLGNRAFFHERMRDLLARGEPFTLFLLDIDYLKELNDRQGHDAGDALIQHIGSALAAFENERTCCARIGGDEFAVLLEGSGEDAAALSAGLDELQGMIWARYTWSGVLSLSIGCAASAGAMSAADLFQRADLALYEAKKQGRGRQAWFDERLQQQIQSRLDLIKQAHGGLRRGEFALHFQPIVDVRSSTLVSVEALLRWNHPQLGMIGPAMFHTVLADKEIGPALQQHVITLAIAELKRRRHFHGTLAVNFTSMDLAGRAAADKLLARLREAGVSPSSLCVEVTEGIILGKRGTEPAEALRALHEAGVQIALDDFGTGYASLVHLKEIPVDVLKIDRSFVAGLLEDGNESEEIVRAVLALGHGLDKTVIAEGVESVAQLLRLRELGCDHAQGFLFGHPSPSFPNTVVRAAA